MSLTLDYYKNNTHDFFESTVIADTDGIRNAFLKYVPAGGHILDFGCGSGRDTKAFADLGYKVEAIDGSPELSKMATEYSGIEVRCMDFFEFNEKEKYDGIWACASLLHVEKDKLPEIITKLRNSLVPGGVLYMSFKYGVFAGVRDGRYFIDLNEEEFGKLVVGVKGLNRLEEWYSEDVRRGKDVEWLNEIVRRV